MTSYFNVYIDKNIDFKNMKQYEYKELKEGQYFLFTNNKDKNKIYQKIDNTSFVTFNSSTQSITIKKYDFENDKVVTPKVILEKVIKYDPNKYMISDKNNCVIELETGCVTYLYDKGSAYLYYFVVE